MCSSTCRASRGWRACRPSGRSSSPRDAREQYRSLLARRDRADPCRGHNTRACSLAEVRPAPMTGRRQRPAVPPMASGAARPAGATHGRAERGGWRVVPGRTPELGPRQRYANFSSCSGFSDFTLDGARMPLIHSSPLTHITVRQRFAAVVMSHVPGAPAGPQRLPPYLTDPNKRKWRRPSRALVRS